ncbi:hypothetical protein BKA62DRAFT_743787 [Auriculariales sp. MPI-PUGE-AT-0066]|nr:hypothetical protein BKA62DRAFT_743787 [Auriculariales sp. MPI-PUGE-AT-0066]
MTASVIAPTNVRDEEYYFEDGSLVILVDSTLFKVHRTRLTKASAVFSDMLSMPFSDCKDAQPDGSSDEQPLLLTGDNTADFRGLLWALYVERVTLSCPCIASSLPSYSAHDLTAFLRKDGHNAKTKCDLLLRLCTPAHKYAFGNIESWALHLIQDFLDCAPHPFTCDVQFTTDFLRAAHLCGASVLELAANVLYKALEAGAVDPVGIVLASDTFYIQKLAGLAYYRLMTQGIATWLQITSLSDAHRTRLLAGHHNLGVEWRRLRESVCVPRAHASRCCATTWARAWQLATSSSRVRMHDPSNILELIASMRDQLRELLEYDVMTPATQTLLLAPLPERCNAALLQSNEVRLNHATDWYKQHFAAFFTPIGPNHSPPQYSLSSPGGLHMLQDISHENSFSVRRRVVTTVT